jgi:ubiquinone/menaquinone biosynthesis C-methylase UbiE
LDVTEARRHAETQWTANPCGAVPGDRGSQEYFLAVERDRYRQQYWQRSYFDFTGFSGKRVLEIGVGLGTDLKQFARAGATCYAVDITDQHIQLARANFASEELQADIRQADATALPFPDAYFDCVYSFGVLHHIPDIENAMGELHRVLKPGGIVMTAVYHLYSVHTAALFARALATGKLFRIGVSGVLATIESGADGVTVKPYVKLYSTREWRTVLNRAGLQPLDIAIQHVHFERMKALNVLRPLDRAFGWYVVAIARKLITATGL